MKNKFNKNTKAYPESTQEVVVAMSSKKRFALRGQDRGTSKVIVAMSGGVDSSVSAALLKEAGYDVTGVFMRCWNINDFVPGECSAEEDEYWARRAAFALNIPFYSVDLVQEYKNRIVDYFVSGYRAGRTPNPDVMCNDQIKFGVFLDKAIGDFGADYIATGHYARITSTTYNPQPTTHQLLKGFDKNKDQTYFLHRVGQAQLAKTLFPIGELTKPQVRELARKFNLPNADKKDSQGLCFIGKIDVRKFLEQYIPQKEGVVVTTTGERVGKHEGVQYYTIGQRKGIGIGGGMPYYVVDKNIKTNTLVVGTRYDDGLFCDKLTVENINWISGRPKMSGNYQASIRYRQEPQDVKLSESSGNSLMLKFSEPQRAITSGQSAVIYDGDIVLGGGIIK